MLSLHAVLNRQQFVAGLNSAATSFHSIILPTPSHPIPLHSKHQFFRFVTPVSFIRDTEHQFVIHLVPCANPDPLSTLPYVHPTMPPSPKLADIFRTINSKSARFMFHAEEDAITCRLSRFRLYSLWILSSYKMMIYSDRTYLHIYWKSDAHPRAYQSCVTLNAHEWLKTPLSTTAITLNSSTCIACHNSALISFLSLLHRIWSVFSISYHSRWALRAH